MRSPIRAAPATPPAGPDSTSAIGRERAAAGEPVPALDCITSSGPRSPAAVRRVSSSPR